MFAPESNEGAVIHQIWRFHYIVFKMLSGPGWGEFLYTEMNISKPITSI